MQHLYIHIPFCDGQCSYCALYSVPGRKAERATFVDALLAELRHETGLMKRFEPDTIYMGGGTPTALEADQLARLCEGIRARMGGHRPGEWTCEAAPNTLCDEKLAALREAGVNRISLGVQTFQNDVLQAIGRRHRAEQVTQALEMAHNGGISDVGIDLIACLPGSTPSTWIDDLHQACTLPLDHISVYALMCEAGTRLHRDVRAGRQELATDEASLRRIEQAERTLVPAGFERYEISNYARPGRTCFHNQACWQGADYLGIGPSAASRMERRRWTNAPDLDAYLKAHAAEKTPPRETDERTAEDDACERIMFKIRTAEGVLLPATNHRADELQLRLVHHWTESLKTLEGDGLVKVRGDRWVLTPRGYALADTVAAAFLVD